jgi:Dna[CI] antecedent, DciA
LNHVCAALSPQLAATIVTAGIEAGQLTIGVVGASWASRLRYLTGTLQNKVGESMGVEIQRVRIKVVPPRPKDAALRQDGPG